MWHIEQTNEFESWWRELDSDEQEAIVRSVQILRSDGPSVGRPVGDTVKGSRFANMKELRTQHRGRPIRTLFAFDPRRIAILLIGGDKTGDKRFYERMIPIADRLYDAHLQSIRRKGLL